MASHRMGTDVPALLLLLVLAAAVSAADMQVRVYLDGKEDAAGLHPLGLDVVWQGKDFIEIIATADELRELEGLGLRTEIVHGDVAAFYRSRLDHARDMGGYKTLAEIQAYMDEIAFFHDAIVFPKTVIGYTLEGRPMYAMKISDNPELDEPDEPEVLYTAAIHAREVITPETVLRFMDYLTDNYGTDPAVTDLVNSRELWFVPVVNPDGYYYNQVIEPDGGGMWRKNRRNNGDGSYGIDLNRNYGYEWGYDDDGSSPVPSDATYRGTGPFSEPETQVMRDFISAHEFVFTLYFHSYSNLVLWPWGYDQIYTPEEPLFRILGDSLAAYNGYEPTPSWGLYVVNGSSDDWGYGEQLLKNKNYAFSIEIGGYSDGFWPDPSRIDQLTLENRGPALFLARVAGNPYQVMPPGQPAVSVDDTVDASGYSVQWSLADTLNPAVLWELGWNCRVSGARPIRPTPGTTSPRTGSPFPAPATAPRPRAFSPGPPTMPPAGSSRSKRSPCAPATCSPCASGMTSRAAGTTPTSRCQPTGWRSRRSPAPSRPTTTPTATTAATGSPGPRGAGRWRRSVSPCTPGRVSTCGCRTRPTGPSWARESTWTTSRRSKGTRAKR